MRSARIALMRPVIILASAVVAATTLPVAAAGPPQQLIGKSVVVNWSNTRQQRQQRLDGSWGDFVSMQGRQKLIIYVSTAARVFSRRINTTSAGSGNVDQIGGQASGAYPVSTPSFSGQTMTVVRVSQGGAERTQISFDAGFTSCTADVTAAYEAGKTSIVLSPITKRRVEIRSVETGAVSCSVQSGNALEGAN